MDPKETPFVTSGRVTDLPLCFALVTAWLRMARMSEVISSASISFRPKPNRCGAFRLSGRVTTSPPRPAEPRGRPWQPAQESTTPAPIPFVEAMSPTPSSMPGPCPCTLVNFRWKSWRPRRTARKASRLMMNSEESGVLMLPRLAPISCVKDLLIAVLTQAFAFGLFVWVLSTIWARAGTASAPNTPRHTRVRANGVFPGARRLRSRMRFEPFARGTPRLSMRAPSRHFCQPVSCGVVLAYVSLEYKATLHIVAMHPR